MKSKLFFGVVPETIDKKAKKRIFTNEGVYVKFGYFTTVQLVRSGMKVADAVRFVKKYIDRDKSSEAIRAKINRLRGVKK